MYASGFSKKETLAQVFFCELCKISKNTFFIKHLRMKLPAGVVCSVNSASVVCFVSVWRCSVKKVLLKRFCPMTITLSNFTNSWRSTEQKTKFFIKDFFSKCDQIRRELHKSLMENFTFCAVGVSWWLQMNANSKNTTTNTGELIELYTVNHKRQTSSVTRYSK